MKKIIIIVSIIVLLAIGLFPKVEVYEDGGTKTYSAFLYKYIQWNTLEGCKEKQVIFFPNNFKSLDSYLPETCKNVQEKDSKNERDSETSSEGQFEDSEGQKENSQGEKGKIVKGVQLQADSENPTWSIMINGDMLVYDSPENEPKKGKDFDVITRHNGNTIYFEGKMDDETISGFFRKQKCISKGKDLHYFVSVDYNDKKLTACGESFGNEIEEVIQNDIINFIKSEVKTLFQNTNFSDYTETTLALKPAKIENPQQITAYKITAKDIDFKESEEITKLFLDKSWNEFPEYEYGLGKYSWNIGLRKDEFTCSIGLKSKDGKKGDLEIVCGK